MLGAWLWSLVYYCPLFVFSCCCCCDVVCCCSCCCLFGGCSLLVVCCLLLNLFVNVYSFFFVDSLFVGCWLLVVGCWVFVVGCVFLVLVYCSLLLCMGLL